MSYRRDELMDVLEAGPAADESWFRVQVSGASSSKHLNISAAELTALTSLLDDDATGVAAIRRVTQIEAVKMPDQYPDRLSDLEFWLDDTLHETAEAKREAAERIAAYDRDEWWMIGIRVYALDAYGETVGDSAGLWGIESDVDDAYANEVMSDQRSEVALSLGLAADALDALPVRWVDA